MPKKKKERNPNKTQNLVIFKEQEEPPKKTINKYTFEEVDQEYKIKCKCVYAPFGSHFRYSILIDNQSHAPITELNIKIRYPEFLTLTRAFPPTIRIPQVITEKKKKKSNKLRI